MTSRRKALGCAVVVVVAALVVALSREMPVPRLFTPAEAPAHEIAIVLGAAPGPLLEQRMDAACELAQLGRVGKLVLSGMPNEMPYMRQRAHGCLQEGDVLVDDGAVRTLENLRRARDLFGVKRALVVTQRFHIDRALYLAGALGIEATGVLALGEPRGLWGRGRERAARIRARLDVALLP